MNVRRHVRRANEMREKRPYGFLVFLLVCAVLYTGGLWKDLYRLFRHEAQVTSQPFTVQMATRTIGSGPFRGDMILSLNGRPFTSPKQLDDALLKERPGDSLHLVLSEPSGHAIERDVRLSGEGASEVPSAAVIAINISLFVLLPLVCLALGFAVAFIRPHDRNAWLLLFLLISFSCIVGTPDWHRAFPELQFYWEGFWGATPGVWMMLFAIYFPDRFALDKRLPWLKYVLLAPCVISESIFFAVIALWRQNIDLALPWRPLLSEVYFVKLVAQMVLIGAFFAILGYKGGTEQTPDGRRRLKILRIGASASLTPIFLVVLYAVITRQDVFNNVSWPIQVLTLCILTLFPLTLAYVIVVGRAMDLSAVLRQSVKYGLARGGLWLLRASLIALAVYVFSTSHLGGGYRPMLLTFAATGLVVIRRKNSEKATVWLDRKFFREAYDSEVLLGELAGEVGRYVEIEPLFQNVAKRISETLHVTDIVILVREGNVYRTRYSTRHGQPMDIEANSRLLAEPGSQVAPLQVYYDSPQPWMRGLSTEELQTLAYMRTELLLVMRGRDTEANQVIGLMSLGPKKSEEPYSKTDMSLLQTVAVQMGMAIQNSRLAASLAESAALREVMNREVEIAREVQERLFPQKFPQVAGLDCFGYCRPARGVGGDYYDFLDLPGGRIGIAIGDVSGKGIAAALLMASLQASLRGQAMAGNRDLAALMRNVNKLVYDASPGNKYATFFYGEFDPSTREFDYVNGGHNPPVVLRGEETHLLEATGPVVGLLPGVDYAMGKFRLQPGDIVVCYTDGMNEAMNERDEEWDDERFIAAARSCAGDGAKDMIGGIFRKADAFTGTAKQHDDMTLLIVKLLI